MPYKSKAQQRKFHADPKLRDKYSKEWDAKTKKTKKGFKGLPERVKKKRAVKKAAKVKKSPAKTRAGKRKR